MNAFSGLCCTSRKQQPEWANEDQLDKKYLPLLMAQSKGPPSRMQRYIEIAEMKADEVDPRIGKCMRTVEPLLTLLLRTILFILPMYVWLFRKCYQLYQIAPRNVISMVFGTALCFFGGEFCASIAAIEAFRTLGGSNLYEWINIIYEDACKVARASSQDDLEDKNHNNIADVDEMTASDLAKHKLRLAMTTIQDPSDLQQALFALFTAYMSVLATLKVVFARTSALALGIADMVNLTVLRDFAPVLQWMLGPDLQHWMEAIVDTLVKVLALIFAWYMQQVISAFYTGLRGSRLFATGLLLFLQDHGLLDKLPDRLIKKPYNPETTRLDELIMYLLAAVGFYYQVKTNFSLPFPLNLIFLPLTIIEWFLRWQITFG